MAQDVDDTGDGRLRRGPPAPAPADRDRRHRPVVVRRSSPRPPPWPWRCSPSPAPPATCSPASASACWSAWRCRPWSARCSAAGRPSRGMAVTLVGAGADRGVRGDRHRRRPGGRVAAAGLQRRAAADGARLLHVADRRAPPRGRRRRRPVEEWIDDAPADIDDATLADLGERLIGGVLSAVVVLVTALGVMIDGGVVVRRFRALVPAGEPRPGRPAGPHRLRDVRQLLRRLAVRRRARRAS